MTPSLTNSPTRSTASEEGFTPPRRSSPERNSDEDPLNNGSPASLPAANRKCLCSWCKFPSSTFNERRGRSVPPRHDDSSRSPSKNKLSSEPKIRGEKTKGERKELPQYIEGNPWLSIKNGWCPENGGTELPKRAPKPSPEVNTV